MSRRKILRISEEKLRERQKREKGKSVANERKKRASSATISCGKEATQKIQL
jgi:hypothetical protein